MRKLAALVVFGLLALGAPAAAQPDRGESLPRGDQLAQYRVQVAPADLPALRRSGFELSGLRPAGDRVQVDLVLDARDVAKLRAQGARIRPLGGQRSAVAAQDGYEVFRPWSGPGNIEQEMRALARDNPGIVKLQSIGRSVQGQQILALKVTRDARRTPDGQRPAVVYASVHHAREWIAAEVARRLVHHVVDGYGEDALVTELVDTRELWFVPMVNPDGYDFTFTPGNRLWRKNLRDNDGDGKITGADGVDLNRNYAYRWGYDNEGSSPDPSDETYRGRRPFSEPETRALDRLLARLDAVFTVSYHSWAELLLYPQGWQVDTLTADEPIYRALSGTPGRSAVPGYVPGPGGSVLYTTNGEYTDHSHAVHDTLGWTPELAAGCDGCGFEFPDDEAAIQAEFERNLPFALDVAKSADDPANPESYLGNDTPDFVVDAFRVSYGDPQTLQATAKRELGAVTAHWSVNGGPTETTAAKEWDGGERYGDDFDTYYRRVRAQVGGTQPGDRVRVWFSAGDSRSSAFSYRARPEAADGSVLIVANEDYTGASPDPTGRVRYLRSYRKALRSAGIPHRAYDVDANGRRAPDPLGVLSHFDGVLWYTGDDLVTRDEDLPAGTASRLANDMVLALRDYLNEGGKLLYTGRSAGLQFGLNAIPYNPQGGAAVCDPFDYATCRLLSDDFLQYWLGAGLYLPEAGLDDGGQPHPLGGIDRPFRGYRARLGGPGSADNHSGAFATASFLPTSEFLPPRQFPQFAPSFASMEWLRPGVAPYEPFTGEWYAFSQAADESYKRLSQTIDLTGEDSGSLSFRTSYDTEPDWDFVFVEAHTVGDDNWTTLPDLNGHTSQDTGASCPEGWRSIHPFLDHYQTLTEDGCEPVGTTGAWHAASGNSGGWQQWQVDLSDYAGQRVEVAITYASDWGIQGLGVFVDDTRVTAGGEVVTETSFEDDLDGWQVPGSPPGSPGNSSDWIRSRTAFEEGAAVTTEDSVYLGFGVEGVATRAARAELVARVFGYLLP